ncbi:hypothetical protein OAV88_02745, partial [bacterium]|nr:hypothetical protein [bacterium]
KGTITKIQNDLVSVKFEDGWIENDVPIEEIRALDVMLTARGKYEAKKQLVKEEEESKTIYDFETLPWKKRLEILTKAKPSKISLRDVLIPSLRDPVSLVFRKGVAVLKSVLQVSKLNLDLDEIASVVLLKCDYEAMTALVDMPKASEGSRSLCRQMLRLTNNAHSTSKKIMSCKLRVLAYVLNRHGLDSLSKMFDNTARFAIASLKHRNDHIRKRAADVLIDVTCLHIADRLSEVPLSLSERRREIQDSILNTLKNLYLDDDDKAIRSWREKILKRVRLRIASDYDGDDNDDALIMEEESRVPSPLSPCSSKPLSSPVTTTTSQKLPYAEPFQKQKLNREQEDILRCYGESLLRCVLSKEWSSRVAAAQYVATKELRDEFHVRCVCHLVSMFVEDRVGRVYEQSLNLLKLLYQEGRTKNNEQVFVATSSVMERLCTESNRRLAEFTYEVFMDMLGDRCDAFGCDVICKALRMLKSSPST